MVERCARAVQATISELTSDTDSFEYICGTGRLASEEIALAVIDALMEPTPEMVEAAQRANYSAMAKGASGLGFKGIYRAMLSKAKEGTGE